MDAPHYCPVCGTPCSIAGDDDGYGGTWHYEPLPPQQDTTPPAFQALSGNGGDEDWLVHCPPWLEEHLTWAPWFRRIDSCEAPPRHELPDGSLVFIGAYA